ncbi:MAG: D-alanyl-D-alanine endopeptidase [Porticoccaceae bacterium]
MILDYARLLRKHIVACVVIAVTTVSFAANTDNTAVTGTAVIGKGTSVPSRVTTIRLRLDDARPQPAETMADAADPRDAVTAELAIDVTPAFAAAATDMIATSDVGAMSSAAAAAADTTAADSDVIQLATASVKRVYKPVTAGAKPTTKTGPNAASAIDTKPEDPAPKTTKEFRGIRLAATSAVAVDANSGETLYFKNPYRPMSIASITKLMTAMVVLDAKLPMQEILTISPADVDRLKHTTSRLPMGTKLSRHEMLRLALMSSENRAASALSRHYPGGQPAFINAMRRKAAGLGMNQTRFNDPTGLTPTNVSTAENLVKMVRAASQYPLIRQFTTTTDRRIKVNSVRYPLEYKNTNRLVRGGRWNITLSKTGYINEAGHCLVMMAMVAKRPVVMVLLETPGKLTPLGDATRLRTWIEAGGADLKVASAQ